jgi:Lar family restriction alleviation protein
MIPLKPCPFCGQRDQLAVGQKTDDVGTLVDVFYLSCAACGAEGPAADSADQAAELWNGRAS